MAYQAMRTWNKWLASGDKSLDSLVENVEELIQSARMAGAPSDAIFQRRDRSWATVDSIKSASLRAVIKEGRLSSPPRYRSEREYEDRTWGKNTDRRR